MENFGELLTSLVNASYVQQGLEAISSREHLIQQLFLTKQLPQYHWDNETIQYLLQQLTFMDSNNFPHNIGVGEREGRIYSSLVSSRHYSFAHGIGRSGNITEVQPKAAGSSLLYKLTNLMVQHAIELSGYNTLKCSLVIPMATGMTLTLCLLTLKQSRPTAKYVIWPRIDQKSCFKCILTAGLVPIIIPNTLVDDEISTNIPFLTHVMETTPPEEVLCVLSTTSCFAPRRPDKIDIISKLCQEKCIPHVINNAYGLQCPLIAKLINRGATIGRIDYVVQSTDKNFMVPVGGAIVSSPHPELIDHVAKFYPGRASSAPILDLFITLLSMGKDGLERLHQDRLRCLPILIDGLNHLMKSVQERVLISPRNTISIGISLTNLHESPSYLGSMLFKRSISGCRVVSSTLDGGKPSTIGGYEFLCWGAHHDQYPTSYLTAACAVGIQEPEIHQFLHKLEKVFKSLKTISTIPSSVVSHETIENDVEGAKSLAAAVEGHDDASQPPLSSIWLEMIERKAKHTG